jgi:hypothetical protein
MKKMIGYGFAVLVGVGALTFEMMESLNFWRLAFPVDKWFLSYLGFFLTSIAMIGYFYEFLFVAVGKTQKTVSLLMAIVCGIGALLTAGLGFKITSYAAQGWQFTQTDLAYMAIIVQALIGLHIVALFVFYGGDAIAKAWQDDDGDGVPNFLDRKDNRTQKPVNVNALETKIAQLEAALRKSESSASNLEKNPVKNESGAEKGDNAHRPTNGQ